MILINIITHHIENIYNILQILHFIYTFFKNYFINNTAELFLIKSRYKIYKSLNIKKSD